MRKENIITNEPSEDSLDGRRVCVTGLAESDAELCGLYFENKRRSKGGELEEDGVVWDQEAEHFVVTFADSHDAARVLEKKDHTIAGKGVQVRLLATISSSDDLENTVGVAMDTTVAPFVVKKKIIEVEGQVPSSAYKDTVNGGPLLDRRQKFLEQVVDTILETPELNEAISKALGVFGNGALNTESVARNKHHATGKFYLEVTMQVAFTSLSSRPLEGEKSKLRTNCSTCAHAAPSPQASPACGQDRRECQQQPPHWVSPAASQGYHSNNTDSSQQLALRRSGLVSHPQSKEHEF